MEFGHQLPKRLRNSPRDWWDQTEDDIAATKWAEVSDFEFNQWLREMGFTGKVAEKKKKRPETISEGNVWRKNGNGHSHPVDHSGSHNNTNNPPVKQIQMPVRKRPVELFVQAQRRPPVSVVRL